MPDRDLTNHTAGHHLSTPESSTPTTNHYIWCQVRSKG
jgi:hypothetical protein